MFTKTTTPSAVPATPAAGASRLPKSPFVVSDTLMAYSAQARWVVYSRQSISLSAFEDEYFKDMMRAVGGGGAAILAKEMLKKYIE